MVIYLGYNERDDNGNGAEGSLSDEVVHVTIDQRIVLRFICACAVQHNQTKADQDNDNGKQIIVKISGIPPS